MINLSEKSVKDFIKIYEQEFDVLLNDSEARPMASEFLRFFALIYKGGQFEKKTEIKNTTRSLE